MTNNIIVSTAAKPTSVGHAFYQQRTVSSKHTFEVEITSMIIIVSLTIIVYY